MFINSRGLLISNRIQCAKDLYAILDVEIFLLNPDGSPAFDSWGGIGPNSSSLAPQIQRGKIPLGPGGLLNSFPGEYESTTVTYQGCPVVQFCTCPLGHNVSNNGSPVAGGPDNVEGLFIVQPQGSFYRVEYDIWCANIGDDEYVKFNDERCTSDHQLTYREDDLINGCVPAALVPFVPPADESTDEGPVLPDTP